MAVDLTTKVLQDGARNVVVQVDGISDGLGEISLQAVVDAAALSPPASRLRVKEIEGNVNGGIVSLYWQQTTPVLIGHYEGQVDADYCKIGGLANRSADASSTGSILLTTTGFDAGGNFNLILHLWR